MTPAEFRAALAAIGWSQRQLAAATGWSLGAVRNWADGKARVPPPVAGWLARQAARLAQDPPPRREDLPSRAA